MSYSPSRVRRNSIFSQSKPRRALLRSSVLNHNLQRSQLVALQNKLTAIFQHKAEVLLQQIERNNRTILILETKLKQNEEQLNRRKYLMNQKGISSEFVEQLIQAQLNKRLSIVSKKFAEMEDAFVVSMFPTNQQAITELTPQPRNFLGAETDFMRLKGQMDEKLAQLLANSNSNKQFMTRQCWEINEQIRINQEVIEAMNSGIENIRIKIFSLESLLRSIQNKGEEFKGFMSGRVEGLKQDINKVTVGILNIENRLGSGMMMKKKDNYQEKQSRVIFQSRSRLDTYASRDREQQERQKERQEKNWFQTELQRQQKQRSTANSRQGKHLQSRQTVTNIKEFRRQVLHKDQISEISSISNSVSFLPNPVFIPKVKTHASNQSSPDTRLAKTKITKTLPLKPAFFQPPTAPLEDSGDQFLDFYHQSSLELTRQIKSPFQQAQYISQNSPLDNTKSALTVPLMKPQLQSSIEDRVRETVFRKNMKTPIAAYLDSNNYVKKVNGAYLFDYNGDVLKCSPQQFRQLCNLRIFVQK